jgi:hypothetical protein
MGIALGIVLTFAVWQTQLFATYMETVEAGNKLQIVTSVGDVDVMRAFLEGHRHDRAVCVFCSNSDTEEMCNLSSSFVRRDLCMDILHHCRAACFPM